MYNLHIYSCDKNDEIVYFFQLIFMVTKVQLNVPFIIAIVLSNIIAKQRYSFFRLTDSIEVRLSNRRINLLLKMFFFFNIKNGHFKKLKQILWFMIYIDISTEMPLNKNSLLRMHKWMISFCSSSIPVNYNSNKEHPLLKIYSLINSNLELPP